jgi:WD40 repeat protein
MSALYNNGAQFFDRALSTAIGERETAFSRDGSLLAYTLREVPTLPQGSINLWDIKHNSHVDTFNRAQQPEVTLRSRFSISGNKQYVAAQIDKGIGLYSVASGYQVWSVKLSSIFDVALSQNGEWLAATGDIRGVHLWNISEKRYMTEFYHDDSQDGLAHLYTPAFTLDSKYVACALTDGTVRLWTLSGTLVRTFRCASRETNLLVFSPDDDLIAATSTGIIYLWHKNTGELHLKLVGHTDYIPALAFSQDGKLLASASRDGTVRVWNSREGSCNTIFEMPNVRNLAFLANSPRLVGIDAAGSIIFWNLS